MQIKNERLWLSIYHLITGEEDARGRVSVVCKSLEKIHPSELPEELYSRLTQILDEAGSKGTLKNPATGEVITDKYTHTSKNSTNKKYAEYAKRILEIYKDYQPDKN